MEKITVKAARNQDAVGKVGHRSRLDSHPPRFEGRLQLSGSQRRLLPGQHPDRRRREAAELRIGNQAALGRLQRHGRRRSESLRRQGAGDRSSRGRGHRPRLGRPRNVSAAEEAALVREAPRMGPPAAADQHVRRHRPRAQPRLPIDPRLLPGRRLPLPPHADHHGQRLRRGRRDVPRHHARPGQTAAQRRRRSRLRAGLLRPARVPDRQRPARRRDLRLRRSARSTRSARRSAPRTRTPRGTWPSSGWSSRRWPSSTSTTTWTSPSGS